MLKNIYGSAFNSCTSLSTFYYPKYKQYGYIYFAYVDMYAFQNCSLTNVYFSGTKELYDERQNPSNHYEFIATTYNTNSRLIAALIFYSEEEPTDTTYRYWHYVNGEPTIWVIE